MKAKSALVLISTKMFIENRILFFQTLVLNQEGRLVTLRYSHNSVDEAYPDGLKLLFFSFMRWGTLDCFQRFFNFQKSTGKKQFGHFRQDYLSFAKQRIMTFRYHIEQLLYLQKEAPKPFCKQSISLAKFSRKTVQVATKRLRNRQNQQTDAGQVRISVVQLQYKNFDNFSMPALQRPIYAKIPLEKRQRLIEMVIQEHMSIAKAGRQLALKPSTAKLIVRKYRQTGRFFIKRNLKTQPQQIQGRSQSLQSNSMKFSDGIYFMGDQQQNMLIQNNVDWTCNLGLNMPDSNYYFVYPSDYSNFFVYF